MKAAFYLQRIMASNSLIMGYASKLFNQTSGHFLKMTLLLMALLFCGNVRAETVTQEIFTVIQANNLGGDMNVMYECGKGGGTSVPQINDNEIRLYQNSSGLGGGFITISVVEGYTITKATIGSSMATYVAYTLNNETIKSEKIRISANGQYTTPSISANSITFYCMGTSSSSRLYINKLSITYTAPAPEESYTVTFNPGTGACETSSLTESNPGAGITLPTATSPCLSDWIFAGWSTTEITAETTTAPQLYAEGSTYHPMANETLYAVYQKQGQVDETLVLNAANIGSMGGEAGYQSSDFTYSGITFGRTNAYINSSSIQIKAGTSNSVWNKTPLPGSIVSVTVTPKTNNCMLYVGDIVKPSTTSQTVSSTQTYEFETAVGYRYFRIGATREYTQIQEVEVKYKLSVTMYHTHPACLPITTPSINISASELNFGIIDNNQTKELSFTLSAVHLTDNVTLSISGTDASFFTCMPTNITKEADGSIAETSIVVTYKPTSVGAHTASLAISSGELINTLSLYGVAEQPILAVPVATDATDVTNTSFTANWDAVTNATSYVVNVWTENSQGFGVKNSSFEDGLQNWDAEAGYSLSTENAHSGNQSLAFSVVATKDLRQTIENLTPGEEITLSYWYYLNTNSSGSGLRFWCSWVGSENNSALQPTTYSNKKGAWTQTIITTTVPEGATALNLEIRVYTGAKGYIDDIIVTQTNTTSNAPISGSPFTVSSGTSLNVTGLSSDTEYCYNVVAKADGYLDSDVSNTICTTTSNTSCALATPVVTATPTTSTIYLQWSPIDWATSYIVSLNAETPQTVTGTSYTFTSLTPSTNYNWSVAASSDECTGIAATGTTETLEQPTVAGVEIVEVDTNGLKLDFHEQDAIASVVIDNEVTVSEGERPIADDIFFSKYFEASGTAKLLGIYNGTNNPVSLADMKIFHRDSPSALLLAGFGGTNPDLIMPNEEIIIYNKGTVDVQNCAEEQENFDKWKPANTTANHSALQFGGKGTITLRRGNDIIDIIGALDENGSPVDGNERPTWGDDPGFTCAGGDNIKTEEIEDDYGLSTNRCLLIRRNHVKSGATAVAQNINAFNTLCTEWGGFHIDDDKDTQDQLTCEGFGYVGGFDYQGYYTQYVQLQTTEFDDLTQNADGTYTLPIPSLHKYSCTNIKLKTLDANGEVLETIIYKVPIIVNQDVTTAAEAFFHFEGDTCKNCDVVIRDEATLTTEAAGKTEFRNVEVYPQATLAVPESESLTVHSLRMRSNAVEDQMPYANIVGTLNNQTNMLYYDMRINNSAYRFFALPDTIKVGSIKFSNGMPAVSGTDFLVMYYDGEQRTTNGGLQSNWKPLSADSSIWAGNGYNIATAKAKMQELRFELEYDKVMGPDTKQVHVYDYGMNDYRDCEITPNNVGWNLVGNPYLYIYENGTGDGLVYGKLEIVGDEYVWDNQDNLRYITYFNDKGKTYQQDKVSRTLRPFKCFFVQVGDPANEEKGLMYVTFNKYKAHNPDRQMVLAQRTPEPSEEQYVAVQLALGDKTDKMGITIDNAYTTEYEIGRDLEKMMNYGTLPHVYAYVNNSQKLAFNAVPEWAAQSVVAGAYFPEAGEYTISLDPNDRPTNRVMAVWLTDMINNVTTNLLLGDYSFYAQRAEQKNRFMIAVELAPEISTSTLVSSADGVYAYIQQRQMTICGLAENSVVSVYDALGHLVIQRNTSDASLTEQLPAAGMYLVKVVNAQQKATLKLLAY